MSTTPAARQYDFWARWYDRIWRSYTHRTLSALLERVEIERDDRVLDIGCGTGMLERRLLRLNPDQHIVGIDLSEQMLQQARENTSGPNVKYMQAGASNLPVEDGSFDVVLSASAFHYFPDPAAALAEMCRVLRPGGRMYLLDWSRDSLIMKLRDAVLRAIDPAHVRCYTAAEIREFLAAVPLEPVRVGCFRISTYYMFFVEGRRRLR